MRFDNPTLLTNIVFCEHSYDKRATTKNWCCIQCSPLGVRNIPPRTLTGQNHHVPVLWVHPAGYAFPMLLRLAFACGWPPLASLWPTIGHTTWDFVIILTCMNQLDEYLSKHSALCIRPDDSYGKQTHASHFEGLVRTIHPRLSRCGNALT